ncbi:hypothetical protein [Anaerotignum sp.]|uniref:hypothetical protein n=1 Tax=Anaerotignum sp. TaxID=2039241 RepID=UPI00332A452A
MSFLTFSVLWTLISMSIIFTIIITPVLILVASLIELFFKFLFVSCKKIYFKLKVGVRKHE